MTRALLLALLLAVPAVAQPARPPGDAQPARPTGDDARAAAAQVVQLLDPARMADQVIAAQRGQTIAALAQTGQTMAQATDVFDIYILPEFKARTQDLLAAFQDVLLKDLTVPELRALAARRDGEAWRSAQAKLPELNAHLSDAARQWAAKVGPEAFQKNRAELAKLGLEITGGSSK